MQGQHSTYQLLRRCVMWEPLCAQLKHAVCVFAHVCVQTHAPCTQTEAKEQFTASLIELQENKYLLDFLAAQCFSLFFFYFCVYLLERQVINHQ